MSDQTRIVRWAGSPDEIPAAATPFALDDAGPVLTPHRSAPSIAVATLAALFLFADQGLAPAQAASPSAGTAMSRDSIRVVQWGQGDELPAAAGASFALDDDGDLVRPRAADGPTVVVWVGGGEEVATTPAALVEIEQDWGPKAGPWPAPVLRVETDPAEVAPAAAAPLPFEDYWHRELFIPPQPDARIWAAEDEIATPPPALLFDDGYRIESFTVVLPGGLSAGQFVLDIAAAGDSLAAVTYIPPEPAPEPTASGGGGGGYSGRTYYSGRKHEDTTLARLKAEDKELLRMVRDLYASGAFKSRAEDA